MITAHARKKLLVLLRIHSVESTLHLLQTLGVQIL
jgi:hypothetical protein